MKYFEDMPESKVWGLVISLNLAVLIMMGIVLVMISVNSMPEIDKDETPIVRVETDRHIIVQNGERVISVTEKEQESNE